VTSERPDEILPSIDTFNVLSGTCLSTPLAVAGAKGDVAALSAKINEPGRAGKYAEAHLNDASSPRNAYPAFWGPFALIGEGAARRNFLIVHCSIFHRIKAATDGRATTTPNQVKALQHPIDPDQPLSPE
jgi:hypothetical protein